MARLPAIAMGLVLGASLAWSQASAPANAKLEREYAKLSVRAASQHGADQAETLAKMAEVEFDFAHARFRLGENQGGVQELDLAVQHADHACALLQAERARHKTGAMKNVEVSLQNIAYGLHDLDQSVSFRQRPKIEQVANHLADLRAQLLQWMFAPKGGR